MDRILSQNPPSIKRKYPKLNKLVSVGQSVLVLGPRGCGKTYFLSRVINQHSNQISIDLLNKIEFERYIRTPGLLEKEIQTKLHAPLIVFIDEIQRIPSLLNDVHRLIELHKPNVSFVLTGSSARKLKEEDANLLAGRAIRIDFFPLGIDEIDLKLELQNVLQFGTLPQVFTQADVELKQAFLKTYVGTYLQEEIQREARIKNLEGFARFLELSALENGTTVNFLKIAKAIGIADTSVKAYYQLLLDTLVAYEIPAWTHSIRKQIHKGSKYYFFDNGIINALTGELKTELRTSSYRYGKLFENFVVTQLFQALQKADSSLKIFYYREYAGREVDLILQKNAFSPCLAIEIKSQESPNLNDVKSLTSFMKEVENSKGLVICQTPRSYEEQGIIFASIEDAFKIITEE